MVKISEEEQSKFRNDEAAIENYRFFINYRSAIKKGISHKVYNGFYEIILSPSGRYENVWKEDQSPIHVIFSWKSPEGLNYAATVSFHISPDKFQTQMKRFLRFADIGY